MTLTDCPAPLDALTVRAVKNTEWQARLKAAGINQKRLAAALGVSENTISRQMKGEWPVAGYVQAALDAWEIMTEAQRVEWLRRRDAT